MSSQVDYGMPQISVRFEVCDRKGTAQAGFDAACLARKIPLTRTNKRSAVSAMETNVQIKTRAFTPIT
jgi:hypothetical protein